MKTISTRSAAIRAALSILAMIPLAAFGFGYVLSGLVLPGTVPTPEEWQLVRPAAYSWAIIAVLDVFAAIYLTRVFSGTDRKLAVTMGSLRIVYTMFLVIGVTYLFFLPLDLPSDVSLIEGPLQSFMQMWEAGLIVFGVHLYFLGRLGHRQKVIHKVWAYLLYLAGAGYIIVESMKLIGWPSESAMTVIESVLGVPMFIGETGLAVVLLIRARRL